MTPQVALARIAALCDDAESGDYPTLPAKSFVRTVRKVLAEVTSGAGATLTPEEAPVVARGVRVALDTYDWTSYERGQMGAALARLEANR